MAVVRGPPTPTHALTGVLVRGGYANQAKSPRSGKKNVIWDLRRRRCPTRPCCPPRCRCVARRLVPLAAVPPIGGAHGEGESDDADTGVGGGGGGGSGNDNERSDGDSDVDDGGEDDDDDDDESAAAGVGDAAGRELAAGLISLAARQERAKTDPLVELPSDRGGGQGLQENSCGRVQPRRRHRFERVST